MASYYNENTIVYHNGKYVKATEAKVDLYGQTMHYGLGVFEGIRSYRTVQDNTKIFKAVEHYDRLRNSALAVNMPYEWHAVDLIDATYEVLRQNNLQDAYIRPLVYGPANMSFNLNTESHIVIEVWEMGKFLGDKLLRVMSSPFQRPNPAGFKIEAKACGHYVNSILASQDAKAKGYDEALLTDMHGFVAEGPGANMFFEKEGVLYTPALGNILPGITRATVIELCAALNIKVAEGQFTMEQLKQADAAFFCGTAAEVIGWESLDEVKFPLDWNKSLGKVLQQAYKDLVTESSLAPEKLNGAFKGLKSKEAIANRS
jgi:branched-chain amino acid aminotransferase